MSQHRESPSPVPSPLKVLLVEGRLAERQRVRRLLRNPGRRPMAVVEAEGLEQALNILGQQAFDLVLLHPELPDSPGIGALTRVLEVDPNQALVVLADHPDEALALHAIRHGAQDCLALSTLDARTFRLALGCALERQDRSRTLRLAHDELSQHFQDQTSELARASQDLLEETGERRRSEEALRISDEKYRLLIENANVGIRILRQGQILYCNAREARIFGYDHPSQMIGRFAEEFVKAEDLAGLRALVEKLYIGDPVEEPVVYPGIRPDGRDLFVESHAIASPFIGEGGVLAFHLDVTDRWQVVNRLARLSECLLQFGPDTLNNISGLVVLCGRQFSADVVLYTRLEDGKCRTVAQWNAPPGLPSQCDLQGHICGEFLKHDEHTPAVLRHLDQTPFAQTDPLVHLYGLKTCLGKGVNERKGVRGSLCVFYRDDRQPKDNDLEFLSILASAIAIEEERHHIAQQLLARERLATIGQTTADIAHSMKNLLTVFNVCRSILDESLQTDKQDLVQRAYGLLDRAYTRMHLLIHEMLDYTKPRHATRDEVAIQALFEEIARGLALSFRAAHIHVETHVAPGAEKAFVDPQRLERSLLNLALNAVDAMSDGGTLRLAAYSTPLDHAPETLRRPLLEKAPHLQAGSPPLILEVRDSGTGIPSASIPHLFEPFYSTKGSSGTGLGLLSVRQFVDDHGGAIHVESHPGQGTAIYLCLPSARGSGPDIGG